MPTMDETKMALAMKARAVAAVLATPDGEALLAALESEFCGEPRRLIGATPQETAYRVGAFDAVHYLKQLQQYHLANGGK